MYSPIHCRLRSTLFPGALKSEVTLRTGDSLADQNAQQQFTTTTHIDARYVERATAQDRLIAPFYAYLGWTPIYRHLQRTPAAPTG